MHEASTFIVSSLSQYGSLTLFALLALGILALPIPDETLLILAGVLLHQGKLSFFPTLLAAYAGAICGISLSYCLGRFLGALLLHKYGKWIGVTPEKYQKVHTWFERFGKWTLFFGYFIMGIRHLTGFAAGISELKYAQFALFAYSGAIVWATCFLSIGYFLGNQWPQIYSLIEQRGYNIQVTVLIILFILILGYLIYRIIKTKKS